MLIGQFEFTGLADMLLQNVLCIIMVDGLIEN